MVNMLYVLKKEYRDKKIYIWDVNRYSIVVFMEAAFRRINVQGFVTPQEKFVGEMYMNRQIVTWNQIEQEKNSIILVSDQVLKDTIAMLPTERVLYWSDALECNEELHQKKIIVYGTGWGSRQLEKVLSKEGVAINLYCVTHNDNDSQQYRKKDIVEANELGKYEEYAVIISVIAGKARQEILETLMDFNGQIYLENIFADESEIVHINLIQSIALAIKKAKKIFLYSKKSVTSKLFEEVMGIYGITISGYVHDMEDKEKNIKSIYTMALEGSDNKLIIINEEDPERLIAARESIEFAGFSLEGGDYTGIQWYTRNKAALVSELCSIYDSLVGYSNVFLLEKPGSKLYGRPGWKIYGKEEENRVRILVLGGSTSAEVWHPENWVSKLYYKLERENIKTVIYNGAHEGNDIVNEMLRLLRDGYILKPQIVISMSGVNNLFYKDSENLFNEECMIDWVKNFSSDGKYCSGVYSDETLYSFWNRNIKLLGVIAEFYGARFFGFLQPMNITIDDMNLWEKSAYEIEGHMEGARNFAESASEGNGYVNLINLFEHQDEMYFDFCHYTNKAHEIIADKVYETIIPTIRQAVYP